MATQGTGGGRFFALFGGNPLSTAAGCATGAGAPPVTISDITILGAHPATSFELYATNASAVRTTAGAAWKEAAAAPGVGSNATLSFDKGAGSLKISGLNFLLKCPDGFELQWR